MRCTKMPGRWTSSGGMSPSATSCSTSTTVVRPAIAINGAFFTTRRMLLQYLINAYFPDLTVRRLLNNWQ